MTSFFTFDGQILPQEHVTRLDQNMPVANLSSRLAQKKTGNPDSVRATNRIMSICFCYCPENVLDIFRDHMGLESGMLKRSRDDSRLCYWP